MNIGKALVEAYNILKKENIESYMLDAQLLLCDVLKKDKLFIITNRDYELTYEQKNSYFDFINIRKNRMPVKYILGECEFMGINFLVKEGVLIPRPDTEILVEQVLKQIKTKELKEICDVCCGSGAIGLSIAKYIIDAEVTLYDISEKALEVSEKNACRLNLQSRVEVRYSDLLDDAVELGLKFDLIVSNPPYIKEAVIPTLMKDVKGYEPHIALNGGTDGLTFYRKITQQSFNVLKKGGVLAFEIGHDQKEEVKDILHQRGFKDIYCAADLAGNDRVVLGIKD